MKSYKPCLRRELTALLRQRRPVRRRQRQAATPGGLKYEAEPSGAAAQTTARSPRRRVHPGQTLRRALRPNGHRSRRRPDLPQPQQRQGARDRVTSVVATPTSVPQGRTLPHLCRFRTWRVVPRPPPPGRLAVHNSQGKPVCVTSAAELPMPLRPDPTTPPSGATERHRRRHRPLSHRPPQAPCRLAASPPHGCRAVRSSAPAQTSRHQPAHPPPQPAHPPSSVACLHASRRKETPAHRGGRPPQGRAARPSGLAVASSQHLQVTTPSPTSSAGHVRQ